MECHACGHRVGPDDRFCNACGASLEGVTDTTQVVTADAGPADEPESATDDAVGTPAAGTPTETPLDGSGGDAAPTATKADATSDTETTPEADTTSEADTASLPRTELVEIESSDTGVWESSPELAWSATGSSPAQRVSDGSVATTDLPATEPITEVWMGRVADGPPIITPYDFAEREPVAITGQLDAQPAATATMPIVPIAAPAATQRFGFNLILLMAFVTGIVSLIALFANVLTITSNTRLVQTADTPPEFRIGTWILDDLADNLSIAGLIAIVAMVAGGVASGFRWRWGSGLAGGAGLAMAGLSAIAVGLAQFPIDTAKAFARVPTDNPFVLTITRDLGYWLLIVAGALGIVLFFASVNDAFGDRRPGLDPWIAALGALAVVVAAAGPLIPENQAVFSDNWYLIEGVGEPSALLLVGRLVQLGLFLIGGVIGFLSVRRWGLGTAIGVSAPAIWLVVSTMFELTDDPVGLGFSNPGAVDMHVHGVTIIGTSAVLAMLVLAVIAAYDQGARERR